MVGWVDGFCVFHPPPPSGKIVYPTAKTGRGAVVVGALVGVEFAKEKSGKGFERE